MTNDTLDRAALVVDLYETAEKLYAFENVPSGVTFSYQFAKAYIDLHAKLDEVIETLEFIEENCTDPKNCELTGQTNEYVAQTFAHKARTALAKLKGDSDD